MTQTRNDQTGITIRPSTYEYATDGRKGNHTWTEVIEAGMDDIEELDTVINGVTRTDTDVSDSKRISVKKDGFPEIKQRKEDFRVPVTWDDVAVHGARRLAGESPIPGVPTEDDVREIVGEMVEERIGPIEQELRELNERLERADDSDGISEADLEVLFREFLKENVVRNARAPDLR